VPVSEEFLPTERWYKGPPKRLETQNKYAVRYERVQGKGLKNAETLIWMERQTRVSQEPTRESTSQAGKIIKVTK
jgi:hypothetical protein